MVTLYASAEAIRREARELDPMKVLITVLSLIPFALGWTVRLAWVLISLLWTAGVVGWRQADAQMAARRGVSDGSG